jgi:hypothetical protein
MGRFLLLFLVAAGVAAAPADAPDSEAPASASDGMLVMGVVGADASGTVRGERAVVADPRTGETRARRLPGGTLCWGPVLAVGDRVVFSGSRGGRAVALSLPLTLHGRPRSLGPLPRWSTPEGVPDDGFVMADDKSGVAWCDGRCRAVHIQAGDGSQVITPPAGLRTQAGADAAFSPDGDRLALAVTDRAGVTRVAVADLAGGGWTVVPGGRLRGYGAIAWSPLGAWVYFTRAEKRVFAWAPGMAQAKPLPVHPGGTVMSIETTG